VTSVLTKKMRSQRLANIVLFVLIVGVIDR